MSTTVTFVVCRHQQVALELAHLSWDQIKRNIRIILVQHPKKATSLLGWIQSILLKDPLV